MPNQLVIEEQVFWKLRRQLRRGIQNDLPHRIRIIDPAHPVGEPESVGSALRQPEAPVGKEMTAPVAAALKVVDPIGVDLPISAGRISLVSINRLRPAAIQMEAAQMSHDVGDHIGGFGRSWRPVQRLSERGLRWTMLAAARRAVRSVELAALAAMACTHRRAAEFARLLVTALARH